jgi:uncharacterized membrane protein YphA (DoxX/SURF4 family)
MIAASVSRSFLLSPWLYRVIRLGLAALFLYAGVVKISDHRSFARIISAYDLVPEWGVTPVSIGLPMVEILAGLGLALGIRGSLSLITGLLVMFVLVLGFGVMNDLEIDCGCFSVQEISERGSLRTAFYRDIGFVAAAAYLYWWKRARGNGRRALLVKKTNKKEGLER